MDLNQLLREAADRKASDLHLKVGIPPILRINGELQPMADKSRLLQENLIEMANAARDCTY